MRQFSFATALLVSLVASSARAGTFEVTGTTPHRLNTTAALDTTIQIEFSQPVNLATVNGTSVRVFGINTGVVPVAFSTTNGGQTLVATPLRPFIAGDKITVTLANTIQSVGGTSIRPAGYTYQFFTRVSRAERSFTEVQSFDVREGLAGPARIYGGEAVDLNGNGFVDLAVICEDSSDVRVYLNSADGSGTFGPRLDPPSTVGSVPSPNEPGDFNNDGFVDICTGNFNSSNVTVLMGNGDGTYGARQDITVGGQARGLAVFDFDADGDTDIACASAGASRVALMFNDGTGTFGTPVTLEAGGNAEYGLAAGDMDNDGILDLVVGNRDSQTVTIMRGNGDGTFALMTTASSGGATWVVFLGDVNNDGFLDVSCANSFSQNGSILMGSGGTLSPPVMQPIGAHTVATDLADLDGDGDLDWILSSFGGGFWRIFKNDGTGTFAFDQQFDADSNPACCVAADVNNDGAIDLVLLDEIANTVRIMRNAAIVTGDMNCDGLVNGADISAFALALLDTTAYESQYPDCSIANGDVNIDTNVDLADVGPFVSLLVGS